MRSSGQFTQRDTHTLFLSLSLSHEPKIDFANHLINVSNNGKSMLIMATKDPEEEAICSRLLPLPQMLVYA